MPKQVEATIPVSLPKKIKRTISPAKWAEMEQSWAEGKFATLADLAAHFKEPEKSIRLRFGQRKLRRGSAIEDYNKNLQEELRKKAETDAKALAAKVTETKDYHYKAAQGLARLAFGEVLKAQQTGVPYGAIRSNLASLETAMKIMKLAREERFAVLGISAGSESEEEKEGLPELVVSEITQDQIDDMQSRDVTEDDESLLSSPEVTEIDIADIDDFEVVGHE